MRTLAILGLTFGLATSSALADPPADPAALWAEVDDLGARIDETEARARLDVRRGLEKTALIRYKALIQDCDREIALLELLYEQERELERQAEALTRIGATRDRIDRARDLINVLQTATRRR